MKIFIRRFLQPAERELTRNKWNINSVLTLGRGTSGRQRKWHGKTNLWGRSACRISKTGGIEPVAKRINGIGTDNWLYPFWCQISVKVIVIHLAVMPD
jgi:hypothetical protein